MGSVEVGDTVIMFESPDGAKPPIPDRGGTSRLRQPSGARRRGLAEALAASG